MKKKNYYFLLCFMVAILIMTVSCTENNMFRRARAKPIEKILETPRSFSDKTIIISGTVTRSGSILDYTGFYVQDVTAEIFVVSYGKIAPAIGEKVTVKGTVEVPFSFGNQKIIYFLEH